MIHITDRTLSCLDDMTYDKSVLLSFLNLLIELDPGAIELSEKMYTMLSPLPEYTYTLRIKNAGDVQKYSDIQEYICQNAPVDADGKIRAEILLHNTHKFHSDNTKVRIQGLDDALCDNYMNIFTSLAESYHGSIEFCPQNRFHCATALAAEWITSGMGSEVATSFAGMGGFAPTEELIMILRKDKTYAFFPEMARLFHQITKKDVPSNKPVIGSRIFHVESGVHVDGILKHPQCYEPYPPEMVGQKRKIILGKQSGTASIQAKLAEFNIDCAQEYIPIILKQVKTMSEEKNDVVSDAEFVKIAQEFQP